jgi:secreted PhoX family phosphatase
MDRRRFLQSIAVAAATPALSVSSRANDARVGALRTDAGRILDLPDDYSYDIVSRAGSLMNDGLRVPFAHDGMAAFPAANGRIVLVCNHELGPSEFDQSAFAGSEETISAALRDRIYDLGNGKTPGTGGTTTITYNPQTGETENTHLSLAGTELNCAGGSTPWGSWLTCEECFELPGTDLSGGRIVSREQVHGYVFEVPATATALVVPRPIKAMGRFAHEAAAVHRPTGVVYMTEDRHQSLFYRFIPNVAGDLHRGGRLQALAFEDAISDRTHNWSGPADIRPDVPMRTRWIDLDNVDSDEDDLRRRGADLGAITFARGEGLCAAADDMVFTCTIGGPARLGQVFRYQPSPFEATPDEIDPPGQLTLIAEATADSLLRNADNLTLAPWGDLIVCEDTSNHCGLVGIRPDGSQYQLADNPHSNSELAGVCFAPDGKTLFVNVQYPGTTLAVTGPFPT